MVLAGACFAKGITMKTPLLDVHMQTVLTETPEVALAPKASNLPEASSSFGAAVQFG